MAAAFEHEKCKVMHGYGCSDWISVNALPLSSGLQGCLLLGSLLCQGRMLLPCQGWGDGTRGEDPRCHAWKERGCVLSNAPASTSEGIYGVPPSLAEGPSCWFAVGLVLLGVGWIREHFCLWFAYCLAEAVTPVLGLIMASRLAVL